MLNFWCSAAFYFICFSLKWFLSYWTCFQCSRRGFANICLSFLPFSSILDTAKWKHACMYNFLFFFFFPSTSWMQTWLYQDKICIYIMCMCIAGDIYLYLCVYLYTHGVLREKCPQLFRKHWRKKKKPHWSVMLLTRSLLNWSQSV